jgi:hypothetical protein
LSENLFPRPSDPTQNRYGIADDLFLHLWRPGGHFNEVFSDLFSGREHFEDLALERLFQIFQDKTGRHPEHGFTMESAIRA